MAGSYFQTETFGTTAIDISTLAADSEKVFGAEPAAKAIATVKPLDLKSGRQAYSLKQTFQILKARGVTGTGNLIITLYSSNNATLAATDKVLEMTVALADISEMGSVGYEITLPSNCKRYCAIGLKKSASSAITGKLVFTNKPTRM